MKRVSVTAGILFFILASALVPAISFSLDSQDSSPVGEKTNARHTPDLKFLYDQTQFDPEKINLVVEDNPVFVDLKREMERLQREKEKQSTASAMENEIGSRIQEMGKLREELGKEVKEKVAANDNLSLLVKLYETISPDKVATILKGMPFSVSLEIMKMMKPKKTSLILSAMDEKFAGEMSRRLIQSGSYSSSSQSKGGRP